MTNELVLEAPGVRLIVSARHGGRMRSLVVRGQELLVTSGPGSTTWGCYPFAPFAGRIRDGRFTFEGRAVELPRNLPPHAIHGTVFEQAWSLDGPDRMSIELGAPWPFAGRVTQWFDLHEGGLDVRLRLAAAERMPAALGWHPWFRRRLVGTDARPLPAGHPVELRFEPGQMYERDPEGLPTGRLVRPAPPPWDDCFIDLSGPPRLTWPGTLSLELSSSADHWVVYDEPRAALCVEPQTAAPDDVNLGPRVVLEAGACLEATMAWRWTTSARMPSAEEDVRAAA